MTCIFEWDAAVQVLRGLSNRDNTFWLPALSCVAPFAAASAPSASSCRAASSYDRTSAWALYVLVVLNHLSSASMGRLCIHDGHARADLKRGL